MNKLYNKGYFTGAFDLFHKGHLNSIKIASSMCEELFVGVSTDELIKQYKGTFPIIPFETRLEIVNSIKGVKLAIPQHDLYDKVSVCELLGADVIFTSNEYLLDSYSTKPMTEKERRGVERWSLISDEANKNGIDVMFIPRYEGSSSTQIKNEIIKNLDDNKTSEVLSNFDTYSDLSTKSTTNIENQQIF